MVPPIRLNGISVSVTHSTIDKDVLYGEPKLLSMNKLSVDIGVFKGKFLNVNVETEKPMDALCVWSKVTQTGAVKLDGFAIMSKNDPSSTIFSSKDHHIPDIKSSQGLAAHADRNPLSTDYGKLVIAIHPLEPNAAKHDVKVLEGAKGIMVNKKEPEVPISTFILPLKRASEDGIIKAAEPKGGPADRRAFAPYWGPRVQELAISNVLSGNTLSVPPLTPRNPLTRDTFTTEAWIEDGRGNQRRHLPQSMTFVGVNQVCVTLVLKADANYRICWRTKPGSGDIHAYARVQRRSRHGQLYVAAETAMNKGENQWNFDKCLSFRYKPKGFFTRPIENDSKGIEMHRVSLEIRRSKNGNLDEKCSERPDEIFLFILQQADRVALLGSPSVALPNGQTSSRKNGPSIKAQPSLQNLPISRAGDVNSKDSASSFAVRKSTRVRVLRGTGATSSEVDQLDGDDDEGAEDHNSCDSTGLHNANGKRKAENRASNGQFLPHKRSKTYPPGGHAQSTSQPTAGSVPSSSTAQANTHTIITGTQTPQSQSDKQNELQDILRMADNISRIEDENKELRKQAEEKQKAKKKVQDALRKILEE